eukprot:5425772-Amphidinium_carterae.1
MGSTLLRTQNVTKGNGIYSTAMCIYAKAEVRTCVVEAKDGDHHRVLPPLKLSPLQRDTQRKREILSLCYNCGKPRRMAKEC